MARAVEIAAAWAKPIAVALGIVLAVLILRSWLPALLTVIFLGGAGLVLAIGIVPSADAYLKITPENPEASFVFAVIIAFFSAVGAALHLWYWNKARLHVSKKCDGNDQ